MTISAACFVAHTPVQFGSTAGQTTKEEKTSRHEGRHCGMQEDTLPALPTACPHSTRTRCQNKVSHSSFAVLALAYLHGTPSEVSTAKIKLHFQKQPGQLRGGRTNLTSNLSS